MRKSAVPAVPLLPPIENYRTIEIDRFVPREQIDAHYLDTRS
jgi:non-homologous end joining protein Ku